MEIENLIKRDKRTFFEKLKVDWFFDTWLSKGFLILLVILSMYAIIRIIAQGIW